MLTKEEKYATILKRHFDGIFERIKIMKKILALALSLVLMLSLTSCDGILGLVDMDTEELSMVLEDLLVVLENIMNGEETSVSESVSFEESILLEEPAPCIRPEYKEAVDHYEAFVDEYVAFMKEYKSTDSHTEQMMVRYFDLLSEYNKELGDFSSLKNKAVNAEETLYFVSALARTKNKIASIEN